MADHYPACPCLHVFLTPDGEEPSDETWIPYTYADIHRVLRRVRDTYANAIGDDVHVFLDHYLNLLGTRFMNDEKLDELCRQIYKNHRQALDLIWERVGSPESGTLTSVVSLLEEDSRWHIIHHANKFVDFVPKEWLEWLPPCVPDHYYPFCVTIRLFDHELAFTVWIGPIGNQDLRTDIITRMREKSPEFGFKRSRASQVDAKWSRISATETILQWGENEEPPEPTAIKGSIKKWLDETYPKMEKMASVLKPLCARDVDLKN
jgi:hypothetical protein